MLEDFSDLLFDGTLDVPCTFTPASGAAFSIPAVISMQGFEVGQEAGKGLSRGIKQASSEWKHFRMPASPFKTRKIRPSLGDKITDDEGEVFLVQTAAPSKGGTYMIYAKSGGTYKGPENGITRL